MASTMITIALVLMSSTLTANAANLRSITAPSSNATVLHRTAKGFETAAINGKFDRMTASDLTATQADFFKVAIPGGLGGPDNMPWASATHIMYQDGVAKQWKIEVIAKKDAVLGTGNKSWIAKTTCKAGSQHCGGANTTSKYSGPGLWIESIGGAEKNSSGVTDLGYLS